MVYTRLSDIDFRLHDLPKLRRPDRILLTSPDFFDVAYVINPHMEGNVGTVDYQKAFAQWEVLKQTYERLGFKVDVLPGQSDLPDMVFCANQTLPFPVGEGSGAVMSQMYAPERRMEVPSYAEWFDHNGETVVHLSAPTSSYFEGMGDAIWHAGRRLLWGGFGFRTGLEVYDEISSVVDAPVLALELTDPAFYHLDTCFSILDEKTLLYFPDAFQPEGLALLEHYFPLLIEAPEPEARNLFACNAHCPDGKHVLIQQGCTTTNQRLRDAGYEPVELDTSEFLKSGGSVFCMKLAYW